MTYQMFYTDHVREAIDILVPGIIIGITLLPQGHATAPCALVMYQKGPNNFVVHYLNYETGGLTSGGYHGTVHDAWGDYYDRLGRQMYYVDNQVPLTGQPQ
jgi:hypothetical protein